jgi:hypothetical protein
VLLVQCLQQVPAQVTVHAVASEGHQWIMMLPGWSLCRAHGTTLASNLDTPTATAGNSSNHAMQLELLSTIDGPHL